ncbi:MAG TPA: hypothetical protein V6D03_00705, partial [Candidatus Caenarcaniphilales bacterium]
LIDLSEAKRQATGDGFITPGAVRQRTRKLGSSQKIAEFFRKLSASQEEGGLGLGEVSHTGRTLAWRYARAAVPTHSLSNLSKLPPLSQGAGSSKETLVNRLSTLTPGELSSPPVVKQLAQLTSVVQPHIPCGACALPSAEGSLSRQSDSLDEAYWSSSGLPNSVSLTTPAFIDNPQVTDLPDASPEALDDGPSVHQQPSDPPVPKALAEITTKACTPSLTVEDVDQLVELLDAAAVASAPEVVEILILFPLADCERVWAHLSPDRRQEITDFLNA